MAGRLPRNVVLLAAASLLADVSGEMLMALLPFLLVAQGATGIGLGLVGGLADALGHAVKPFAGALADRMRRRKPLILGGYLTAALARIGIALATAWPASLFFRAIDRGGKGLRSAPRDALLAESVPPSDRGRAFGLHRAADTGGAVLGTLAALAGIAYLGSDPDALSTLVLLAAFIGLSTLLPLIPVRETTHAGADGRDVFEAPSPRYNRYLLVAALGALGQVSYLFFLLRAATATSVLDAVGLYLLFNLVYLALSYPAGRLSDRIGRPRVLAVGFLAFAIASALLIPEPDRLRGLLAFAILGAAFAGIDGVERAYAADLAGSAARSTRLGIFHGIVGAATLVGGLVAGWLWDTVAPAAAFAWGAALPLLALAALATGGFLRGREAGA